MSVSESEREREGNYQVYMNGLGVWEWGGIILKRSLCVMRETEIKILKNNKKRKKKEEKKKLIVFYYFGE
jgi:hypothetical protein